MRAVPAGGGDRTYRAYRPPKLTTPAPLVLVFHGYGGDSAEMERATGWVEQADRSGFVVVFPEGTERSFNGGGCCGVAAMREVDDVAATLAIIDDVAAAASIDPDRVYSTGFSNGGYLSYRLACETDRFAAIAPVAGARTVPCDDPAPTSLLHIHGLADERVPFGGGRRDGVDVPPTEDTIAGWRAALRCAPERVEHDGGLRRSHSNCSNGRAVELRTLASLGHSWPRDADGLDATGEIADFFRRYRR